MPPRVAPPVVVAYGQLDNVAQGLQLYSECVLTATQEVFRP